MIVIVDPQRPIPGILEKNKFISEKTKLDLNRNEIIRCMNFGSVYDENMNILDENSLNKIELHNSIKNIQTKNKFIISSEKKEDDNLLRVVQRAMTDYIVKDMDQKIFNDIEKENSNYTKQDIKREYSLNIVSCEKVENAYIVTIQFNSSDETIDGNMYGLFNVIGSRPSSLEYKVGNDFVKFNNKFANFSTLTNCDTFVFRVVPRNNSNIKFKVSIKENNEVLASVEDIITIQN